MTKRFLPLILGVLSLFLFGSCGGGEEPVQPEEESFAVSTYVEGTGGSISTNPLPGVVKKGTSFTFQANPDASHTFAGWVGSLSGTENPKTVTVTSNMNVGARFSSRSYPLSLSVEGNGTVSERIIGSKASYDAGTVVELTAKPADDWVFDHWEGNLSGNKNPEQITISQAMDVKAVFVKKTYNLSISFQGEGTVEERIVGTKADYAAGTVVELTAKPSDSWHFDHWEGDLLGNSNPEQITITGAKSVTVVFKEDEVEFEDDKFRLFLLAHYDSNQDGILSKTEIINIRAIDVTNEGFKTIKEIGKLSSLTEFFSLGSDDKSETLESLDMSGNKELTIFRVYNNTLRQLTLNNEKLTELECSKNNLSVLDLSHTPALKLLRCFSNPTGSLDCTNLPLLDWLDCCGMGLTKLDLSHNPLLRELRCHTNPIKSLDLSDNTELTYIDCYSTDITELNVSNNLKLTSLHTWNCPNLEVIYLKKGQSIQDIQKDDHTRIEYIDENTILVTAVTVTPTSLELETGQSYQLAVTVSPDNASNKTVTWSSDNPAVATVSGTGLVTAMQGGSASITAIAGGKSATCIITVKSTGVAVEQVVLSPSTLTLQEGQTGQLTATVYPDNATDKTVSWTSSNPSVASVSNNGLVTAIKEGNANIIATAGGKTASCSVSVQQTVVAVTGITLNKTALYLKIGQTETLYATVTPNNATDKTVYWSSSNPNIASVDQSGKVQATGGGYAVITAYAGFVSATCEVIVTVPVESVSLNLSTLSLNVGDTANLVATVNPSDATDKTVTWNSSNPSIVSVTNSGRVTAIAEGNAIITASAGGKTATCSIIVNNNGSGGQGNEVPSFGTIVESSGVGLVVWVSDNNSAAMLMSVEELRDKDWPSSNSWCESYGEGWRMPTIDELTIIAQKFTQINAILNANHYTLLTTANKCYWSSTVNPSNSNYYYRERLYDGTVFKNIGSDEKASSKANYTRAIKMIGSGDIPVPVSSITLNKNTLVLSVGQAESLIASVLPDNATDKKVTWTSSKEEVATVDASGRVTAIAEGYSIITASAGGKTATCSVTVSSSNSLSIVPFEDDAIKRLCLINFDSNHDGIITYEELASVTTIGQVFRGTAGTAFSEFQYFTGVTSLDKEAFFDSKIERIILPTSIRAIGKGAFKQSGIREIVIPNGAILSDSEIFRECYQLTEVRFLCTSTVSIPDYSFYGCESLKNVIINCSISLVGNEAFKNCTSLVEFNLSDVQVVKNRAFANTSLSEAVFSESLTDLWAEVFMDSQLVYADLSKSQITILNAGTFRNTNLREVRLPSTLEEINRRVFLGDKQLTTITIPASVKKIHEEVFGNSGVTELYLMPSNPPTVITGITGSTWKDLWRYSAVSVAWDKIIIYVPKSAYDNYQQNKQWSSAPLVGY